MIGVTFKQNNFAPSSSRCEKNIYTTPTALVFERKTALEKSHKTTASATATKKIPFNLKAYERYKYNNFMVMKFLLIFLDIMS